MATAWRLIREKHSRDAFSGEGACLFGGRNSKGTPVSYLTDSPALCQLEVLANTRDYRQLEDRVLFRVRFSEKHLLTLAEDDLPSNWTARPPTERAGRLWEERARPCSHPAARGIVQYRRGNTPQCHGIVQTNVRSTRTTVRRVSTPLGKAGPL